MLTESPFLDTPIAYILLMLFGGRRIVDIKDDKEERDQGGGWHRMFYSSGNFLQQGCELLQQHHQPVQQAHHQCVSGAPCWPVTRLCK